MFARILKCLCDTELQAGFTHANAADASAADASTADASTTDGSAADVNGTDNDVLHFGESARQHAKNMTLSQRFSGTTTQPSK